MKLFGLVYGILIGAVVVGIYAGYTESQRLDQECADKGGTRIQQKCLAIRELK